MRWLTLSNMRSFVLTCGQRWERQLHSSQQRFIHINVTNLTTYNHVGFEVLTAVVMKITIFWDIMLCSPLNVNRHFGGTYHLHLQGRRMRRAKNQRESSACHMHSWWFLAWLILQTWRLGWRSSKTSVDTQRTTWRYIPEDSILQHLIILWRLILWAHHNRCLKNSVALVR
jgi:hypothetical protein